MDELIKKKFPRVTTNSFFTKTIYYPQGIGHPPEEILHFDRVSSYNENIVDTTIIHIPPRAKWYIENCPSFQYAMKKKASVKAKEWLLEAIRWKPITADRILKAVEGIIPFERTCLDCSRRCRY